MDITTLFEDYIFKRIIPDIEIVLETARVARAEGRRPHGQVLCALGLLTHTEFIGRLYPQARSKDGNKACFDRHFRELGDGYRLLLDTGYKVYDDLRHGLAHRYFVRNPWALIFFSDHEKPFDVFGEKIDRKSLSAGIGVTPKGYYYMVIDRYLADFDQACHRLYNRYQSASTPPFPDIKITPLGWASS